MIDVVEFVALTGTLWYGNMSVGFILAVMIETRRGITTNTVAKGWWH